MELPVPLNLGSPRAVQGWTIATSSPEGVIFGDRYSLCGSPGMGLHNMAVHSWPAMREFRVVACVATMTLKSDGLVTERPC